MYEGNFQEKNCFINSNTAKCYNTAQDENIKII